MLANVCPIWPKPDNWANTWQQRTGLAEIGEMSAELGKHRPKLVHIHLDLAEFGLKLASRSNSSAIVGQLFDKFWTITAVARFAGVTFRDAWQQKFRQLSVNCVCSATRGLFQ